MRTGRRPRPSRQPRPVSPQSSTGSERALRFLLLAGAGYYLVSYLAVALLRLPYPFELEWLEGVVLEHVRRVLAGQALYVAPSLSFVPLNYTPLYFYVCAAFASLLGASLPTLRLVSFLASLGVLALLFALVRRETRSLAAAWLAVGLFAAAYRLGGAWLDVARADSLYLAFVLAGVWTLRADHSPVRAPLLAALSFALAFATKQSALVVVAPLALWLLIRESRRGWILSVALGLLATGTALLLDRQSGGWFRYYAFDVARRHPMSPLLVWTFPLHDLLPFVPALAVLALALARKEARPARDTLGFYAALLVGLLGSAWQLRLYTGGYDNVLMTAHLGLALAVALAWAALMRPAAKQDARGFAPIASAALLLQLGLLWWSPARQLPSAADRAADQRLLDAIREVPGRVFVSSHSYLAARAGKPDHVHVMPFMDVVKGSKGPVEAALLAAMRDTLAAHAYPTLVMDNRDWLLEEALLAGYLVRGGVFPNGAVAWPVTGMRTRPEYLLTPRTPADSARQGP